MNASELRAKIAEIYECVEGPKRAMFEIPCGVVTGIDEVVCARVVYETILVAIRGEQEFTEDLLCQWALLKLSELISKEAREDRAHLLFWRRLPTITEFIDTDGRTCTRLSMRLAIPGIDISGLAHREGDGARWL